MRSLLPALAVLALIGVVAVAATGSTPVGTGEGRPPSETVLDTFFSLSLVLLVVAGALFVYGLLQRRAIAQEIASGRYPRTSLLGWLVFASLFGVASWLAYRGFDRPLIESPLVDVGAPEDRALEPEDRLSDTARYKAEFAWIPVIVVVALAALAALAWVASGRRRSARPRSERATAEQLADALDEALDDLRGERDPRRAVIAAFARLERALAAAGVVRAPAETADELVQRALEQLEVDAGAAHALAALFVRAKFSQHAIDEAMKEDAIDALERVRDDLRHGAWASTDNGSRTPPPDREAVAQ